MINIDAYAADQLWCGVFQGGGARGVAYAGALTALHARRQWFSAVAGSSAGAITAALVAAGLEPKRIRDQTPRLLACVQPDTVIDRLAQTIGWRGPVRYDSTALEHALDRLLVTALNRDDDRPVTFAELHEATRMRLYVIVGDASTGAPIPFCVETTPELSVAAAVIASCSIPVIFEPRYAAVDLASFHGLSGPVLRRLQDGGLWANFPTFVFSDQAFRTYHGLSNETCGRVLGFTVLHEANLPNRISRFVDVPHDRRGLARSLSAPPNPVDALTGTSARPGSLAAKAALARRGLPWVTCLLAAVLLLVTGAVDLQLPAAALIVIAVIGLGTISRRWTNLVLLNLPILAGCYFGWIAWHQISDGPTLSALVTAIIVAVLGAGLIMVGLVLHQVTDRTTLGLHGALTLLTGQTIRPAPWVDQLPGSHVIHLPTGAVTTLAFDTPADVVADTVLIAELRCAAQLDRILTGESTSLVNRLRAISPHQARPRIDDTADLLADIFPDHQIRPPHRRRPDPGDHPIRSE